MLQEFKAFISRGNAMDMAVGIIIGAAFTAIVTSLVDDLVNPLIGIFVGGIDFSAISFGLGEAQFMVGNFVNAVIKFLIIAFVVFMLVRTINKVANMNKKEEALAVEEPAAGPTTEELLIEIRDALQAR
ncbi:large conductance mechanosensitive channel [Roseinatronobacter thiooxidans]|uniref:Large-conductance mechanosensitive channel n=1 Tax=Roseinatronobacter thiooxidans TaxID=121821 RepID=A0A2W7R7X3_9RHOB|nr:large conductance mechanosensitive channel protein MscL [Roseinatronobacter thiooxidans]PZX46685.1 large conductance mechanosensitive channel [Roseinatronobacter thiooxidans]